MAHITSRPAQSRAIPVFPNLPVDVSPESLTFFSVSAGDAVVAASGRVGRNGGQSSRSTAWLAELQVRKILTIGGLKPECLTFSRLRTRRESINRVRIRAGNVHGDFGARMVIFQKWIKSFNQEGFDSSSSI